MPNQLTLRLAARAFRARRAPVYSLLALAALVGGVQSAHAAGPVVTCTSDPQVFNTAYNGTTGVKPNNDPDTHWQVTTIQPVAANATVPMSAAAAATLHPAIVGNLVPGAWAASPYATANWISNEGNGGQSADGDWYYVYDFMLDPAVNPTAFSLQMNYLSDNSVAEVYINDVAQSATGVPQAGNLNGYQYGGFRAGAVATTTLNANWQTGQNRMVVRVQSGKPYEGFLAYVTPSPVCGTAPRVSVAKTAPATLVAGSAISYTVTATNTGSAPADGTVVTDTLPASLTNVSWNCAATSGAVCPAATGNASLAETIATFPAGSSVVYTITATVPATAPAGPLANTATLTPPTGGVCDGPGGACDATVTTTVSAPAAVPTLGQWALLLLSVLIGLSLLVQHRRGSR